MNAPAAVTLDVREILPRNRHPLIFGIFEVLPIGQALLLTNDHDPKPLFYQFQAESTGLFSWDYIEQGLVLAERAAADCVHRKRVVPCGHQSRQSLAD